MELRGVLESGDVDEITAKSDALQQAWTEAAQALYAQASSQPTGNGAAGDGAAGAAGASDDEVVEDAEYEVVDDK